MEKHTLEVSYFLILNPNCSAKVVGNKVDFMPFLENNSKFLLKDFFFFDKQNGSPKLLLENLASKSPAYLIVECASHTVGEFSNIF